MSLLFELILLVIPVIILSWVIPNKWVLGMQVFFCGLFLLYKSPLSFIILGAISIGNFYWLKHPKIPKKVKLIGSVLMLFISLVFVKLYHNFQENWLIPLGMSYYIFKNIHFTIETYLGNIKKDSLLLYLAYNFFLPVIIIGPINRYPEFVKDWHRRRFNTSYLSQGFERILFGIAKIFILGNYIFTYKVEVYLSSLPDKYIWLKTYFESIRFVLNAYFQFAGYSDVAIGLALLMGYRINENFNNPFWASNMRDFWSRYHMSLSSFCKDYIYNPIASYYRKPTIGIIATMLIISLWHQIGFQYLVWGIFQAIGIYAVGLVSIPKDIRFIAMFGRVYVLNFFALSSILISENSMEEALTKYAILINFF